MDASKLLFNEIDLTQQVAEPPSGIIAVSLCTKRGPFGHDGSIMTSPEAFKAKYGGETVNLRGVSQLLRAMAFGAQVRVNRIGAYESDAATFLNANLPSDFAENEDETPVKLFNLDSKYSGADYNNITVILSAASNGDDNYFDIRIVHNLESGLDEHYRNLRIPGALTIEEQENDPANQWLKPLTASKWVIPSYRDLSDAVLLVPVFDSFDFTGGDDGDAPASSDYIGDVTLGNGLHAFDGYDDFMHMGVLDTTADEVIQAMLAYSDTRKDFVPIFSLDFQENLDAAAIIATMQGLNIDTPYGYAITGGLKVYDRVTNSEINLHEIGDTLGIAAKSEVDFGPWYSFAGHNRGVLRNIQGVVNNFGTPAKANDLDLLANARVNAVINRKGKVMIWGNFSTQLDTSIKSFISNVKLGIYIKKSLTPTLEAFLEEPLDLILMRRIYNTVDPFLRSLVTRRAVFSAEWRGDQFADSLDNLQVNVKEDVLLGKYKAQLGIVEIASLREFTIDIVSTLGGNVEITF